MLLNLVFNRVTQHRLIMGQVEVITTWERLEELVMVDMEEDTAQFTATHMVLTTLNSIWAEAQV